MLFIIIRTPVCNVMLARRAITTHTNSIYLYAFLFNVIYTYNTYIPTPICVLYYMYTCKYIGICTRIFRKNTPSFSLSIKSDLTRTNQTSQYVSLLSCSC